jgi:4-amino-4-deoxy-L-arabinose transferase-like glycosyltransferase
MAAPRTRLTNEAQAKVKDFFEKADIWPMALMCVLLAAAWLIYAAFFASNGIYNLDEAIYVAMIDRFATAGSFVIGNGYDIVPAESLRVVILREGPHGLVPQYPAGFAILAAPFYLLGGLQGVIFLNTLATALTLWLTYCIAQALFDDKSLALSAALIFGLATFAVDYAFAIWPHATANLFVAAGIYAAVLSVAGEGRYWRWAALAGLAIGIGVTVRVDVIIAAPVLFVWMFVNTKRPARDTAVYIFALSLGLLLAAWLNYLKFGVFNPLTYGVARGGSAVSGYAQYLPYVIVAALLVMSLRWRKVRALLAGRRSLFVLAAALLAVLVVPPVRDLTLKILSGLYVLLIDIEQFARIENYPGADRVGEHYLFFGVVKKPLVQSLPYLGVVALVLAALFRTDRRWAYALCLVFPLVWFLPYTPTQWFGGLANNMRYFSPALPMLAIVGAIGWREVSGNGLQRRGLLFAAGLLMCILLVVFWAQSERRYGAVNAVFIGGGANLLAYLLLGLAIAWLVLPQIRERLRASTATLLFSAFCLAFVSAYAADVRLTNSHRNFLNSLNQSNFYIEPDAHVLSLHAEPFVFQLTRERATLAITREKTIEDDIEFIQAAMNEGRPVYLHSQPVRVSVMRALASSGQRIGQEGFTANESLSPVDGRHHGLFKLQNSNPVATSHGQRND